MKTQIAAMVIIALIASTGIAVGLPEDLVGYDTPSDRAWEYGHKIVAYKAMLERQGLSEYRVQFYVENLMDEYQYKIEQYRNMYEHIMVTELTTSDVCENTVEVDELIFQYNGYTVNIGNGSFTYNTCTGDVEFISATLTLSARVTAYNENEGTATLVNIEWETVYGTIGYMPGPVDIIF